ncbi:type 2 periplasmic-binding domain-containing protein [Leifsonia xyli]|jgi:putative spermidine/putrescine transport system substrate-binding protein|uniref:hypothetical protein n=1 Tax=Leifsonia xyli TaxID=1575 RepID=UPI00041051D4|nr:hypothetical protein [Leifsonia xyli]
MEQHPIERRPRRRAVRVAALIATTAAIAATLSACAGASSASTNGSSLTLAQKQKAVSVADFGGMDALVAAAKAEGHLNVITLPPSWANYGKIIAGFQKKYPGIQVTSENPNGSSADEVAAARAQKGQSTAPDVFDIGTAVLSQNLDLVAPSRCRHGRTSPPSSRTPKARGTTITPA